MPSPKKRRVETPEINISQIIEPVKRLLNSGTDISVWRQCHFQDAHLESIQNHFSNDSMFLIDLVTQDNLQMLHSFFLDENANIPFVAIMRELFENLLNSNHAYFFEDALINCATTELSEEDVTALIDITFSLYLSGDNINVETLFMSIYVNFYINLETSVELTEHMTACICEKIAIMDSLVTEETPLLRSNLKELCVIFIGKTHMSESKTLLQRILNQPSIQPIYDNLEEKRNLLTEVIKAANEEDLELDLEMLALLLEPHSLNALMTEELMAEIEKNPLFIPFMEAHYHDTDIQVVPDVDHNTELPSYTAPEKADSSIKRDFSVPEQMEDDTVRHIPRRLERRAPENVPVNRTDSNESDISFSFLPQ